MAIRKPKVRELGEAIRAIIKGPFTTKFPFEEADIIPEFRGFPEFVDEDCVRCGACSEVCPVDAIEVEEVEENGRVIRCVRFRYDICILCGQCGALCTTTKGIVYTNEFDKSTFDRNEVINEIEDELVLCEKCGKSITTKKHLQWIAERIGEKAYANPTLILPYLEDKNLVDIDTNIEEPPEILREDLYKILCPECRRAVWMKENFL
ncbi:4Fe-4S binding protein [candidate division WOR-3 bacterium]|nr:4Fe-4S binding protein [candidate division WOR-3 bacterium]